MKRLDQLTQLTAAQLSQDDIIGIRDQSAGQTKYITVKDLTGAPEFGWQATGESWAYSSWTAATRIGVITVPTDATTKYQPGNRVRFSQTTGGTKYGIIHAVTATTLTVFFPVGTTFNNEAITSPVFSPIDSPFGFDKDIVKWTLEYTDFVREQVNAPSLLSWYYSDDNLVVGPGSWFIESMSSSVVTAASTPYLGQEATLSTSTSSESHPKMTVQPTITPVATTENSTSYYMHDNYKLASQTTFYLIMKPVQNNSQLYFGISPTGAPGVVIRAVSNYA